MDDASGDTHDVPRSPDEKGFIFVLFKEVLDLGERSMLHFNVAAVERRADAGSYPVSCPSQRIVDTRAGNSPPDSTDVAGTHEPALGIVDLKCAGIRATLEVVATVNGWDVEKAPDRRERNTISIVILPADGTALPKGRIGDFGTSPIYGQL